MTIMSESDRKCPRCLQNVRFIHDNDGRYKYKCFHCSYVLKYEDLKRRNSNEERSKSATFPE